MVSESKKITVGFFPPANKAWMGGVNYYCNLFYALSISPELNFNCIIFLGRNASQEVVKLYNEQGVRIVQTSLLDRFTIFGIIDRLGSKMLGKRLFLNKLLKRYSVYLVSHVQADMGIDCDQIGWIPDFQHVHLPEMFSAKEIADRNSSFQRLASKGKAVILSSYDALNDFKVFTAANAHKGCVAQFVSQPPDFYFDLTESDRRGILDKYDINRSYIYVPNQFWRHKNHHLLLEAVCLTKQQGLNPLILCSGLMEDYRDALYIDKLKNYVVDNNISENIKFLGLIPYKDVFSLIKFSRVVLNPSKFEGWSSTVEECKSAGKLMLLSDLAVHKEQYPEAIFFEVDSAESLANQIINILTTDNVLDFHSTSTLTERTQSYADAYSNICLKVLASRMPS